MVKIAPSLLAADFLHLEDQLRLAEQAGVELLHLDIMDGHFVPNLSFGPSIVAQVNSATKLPLDVHLMISNPEKYIERYLEAGADYLTVHGEVIGTDPALLNKIRAGGARAGVSLNPDAQIGDYESLFEHLDLFLVMSVYAGFGGQSFLPETMDKVRTAARWRSEKGLHFEIAVDGGIEAKTAIQAREAGADILVAGTAFFGATDVDSLVASLRGEPR
jgi:ribulose-phosphate 3-epimerase